MFSKISVYAISGIPFNYIKSSILSIFLPFYNFIDFLFNIIPFIRNKIGSFLITKIKK